MALKASILFCAVIVYIFTRNGDAKKVAFSNVPTDVTDNIFIYLIKGPTYYDYAKLKLEDGLEFGNFSYFNEKNKSVFYFHGWGDSAFSDESVVIGEAFLVKHDINLAVFDYSALVKNQNQFILNYLSSFLNVTNIGTALGQYIKQYTSTVQSADLIHLLSHSLGSQVMSQAARTYGTPKLPWLTGLDPAGPLFNLPTVEHLSASDGVFVDVIHTDKGYYGDARSDGTVDFFPNRGKRIQPACSKNLTDDFCSHHMSYKYYAESINNLNAFPARKCNRNIFCSIIPSLCSCENIFEYMGYNVNKSATGNYFLITNNTSPYSEGMAGAHA